MPRPHDGVFEPGPNRSARLNGVDRGHGDRQRGAGSIRDGLRGEWRAASVPIAAARQRGWRRGVRIVAVVIRFRLSRHVGRTRPLTAPGRAHRQCQRRRPEEHRRGQGRDAQPKTGRMDHGFGVVKARSVPARPATARPDCRHSAGVPGERRRSRCGILGTRLSDFKHRSVGACSSHRRPGRRRAGAP